MEQPELQTNPGAQRFASRMDMERCCGKTLELPEKSTLPENLPVSAESPPMEEWGYPQVGANLKPFHLLALRVERASMSVVVQTMALMTELFLCRKKSEAPSRDTAKCIDSFSSLPQACLKHLF
jgi:hypothetical protein